MNAKRRVRGSSVLRDVQADGAGADQPNIYTPPDNVTPPSTTGSTQVLPGALYGHHYAEVRNVIEIPFDDSLDSSFPLECFFVMPTGTTKVNSAKVYFQQKPFRMYSSGASSASGGGSTATSGGGTSHTHNITYASVGTSAAIGTDSLDSQGLHDHFGAVTNDGAHSHNETMNHNHSYLAGAGTSGADAAHTHDVTIPSHSHGITLSPGIFESGPSGTVSLQVADDGSTYGAAIVSGVTSLNGQDLTGLTTAAGAKRIKFTATGLQRAQILVVLDLLVQVVLP